MPVLLTAGPTSVFIDSVRIISNISSGKLSYCLYSELMEAGFDVDLFVSRMVSWRFLDTGSHLSGKIREFFLYDNLKGLIESIPCDYYDVIFHTAAVSDFVVVNNSAQKIKSGQSHSLLLHPLPKLWKILVSKSNKVVLFKLEDSLDLAISSAKRLLEKDKRITAVVANSLTGGYEAVLVDRNSGIRGYAKTREQICKEIVFWAKENICMTEGR